MPCHSVSCLFTCSSSRNSRLATRIYLPFCSAFLCEASWDLAIYILCTVVPAYDIMTRDLTVIHSTRSSKQASERGKGKENASLVYLEKTRSIHTATATGQRERERGRRRKIDKKHQASVVFVFCFNFFYMSDMKFRYCSSLFSNYLHEFLLFPRQMCRNTVILDPKMREKKKSIARMPPPRYHR